MMYLSGTGKTVALLSLITSYQLANPEIGKLIYCTRTVPGLYFRLIFLSRKQSTLQSACTLHSICAFISTLRSHVIMSIYHPIIVGPFAEMEKALEELKAVVDYQMTNLELDSKKDEENNNESTKAMCGTRLSKSRRILGIGMTSRRNLCIHPEVAQEADRDKVDERCTQLTAPWIRRKRLMNSISQRTSQRPNRGISSSEKGRSI